MRITIVSTAYPLRGGIAQYTGILYKKLLERGHEVEVITFKRQYPALLFPGKTQMDSSEDDSVKIKTEPIIDSIGPLSWFRTARRIRKSKPDLLLFKFWMPFFAPCFGTIAMFATRGAQTKVLYLCDNIIPHEKRPGDIALTKFAFRRADAFIVQSGIVEKELLSLFPQAKYKLVPHPVYDIFGEAVTKEQARQKIGIPDKKTILFFGYVRKYKGLDLLLRAMPGILGKLDLTLLVVGEFYDDEQKYRALAEELDIAEKTHIHSDFVPNEQVNTYFSAADVVVLPYKSATQSGIVQLAYHFNKPCIVTDVGGLSEIVIDGKTGFVAPPENPDAIADAVLRFYSDKLERAFSEEVAREKQKYSWDRMAEAVEELTTQ